MFFKKEQKYTTDVKTLLPVGSVVLLKDAEKKLMIAGIVQSDGPKGKIYDYMGVYYPEGSLGGDMQFLFNQEDIDQVFFRGYEDKEREDFISQLQDKIK